MKKIEVSLIYFVSFIWLEMFFKIFVFGKVFSLSLISLLLFLLPMALFLGLIVGLFKEKVNRILFFVILFLISFWFSAEYVCKSYFDFYISWSVMDVADQLNDFAMKAIVEILKRIPGIIVMFVPFILTLIFNKKINFEKNSYKKDIVMLLIIIVTYISFLGSLNIKKNATYSARKLYYEINDVSLNMEKLGVMNTLLVDTKRTIFGFEEKIVINEAGKEEKVEKGEEKTYKYNNFDIDFDALISSETNDSIKQMHEYFKNDSGTLQNEYTKKFKDKNLILFMAESFNEVAVDEKLTPTLYKLVHGGFEFTNFYTPTIYSTIGGEFQELTGLYAQSTSILGKFRSGEVSFPLGIANVYKNIDYSTYAYHNNSYRFQDRDKYLKSLGFDNFKACGNGLEKLINCKEWPQSDVEMIENTVNDYITSDKFMVFYASVSGHSSYDWKSNAMAKKNKEEALAAELGLSEAPYSYVAANMELDKALELLISKLEENDKLDDTVIALVGDHYPYELTTKEVNEVKKTNKDEVVEINHSNFILWNNKMEPVKVDKIGSQIDVIPTLYNLFGINYDSRLFIGKDILSTEPGLAMFGNRSWVSDKGTYYSRGSKFVPREGVEIDDNYVKEMNQLVNNRINMSKLIIENNYYAKVIK